MTTQRAFPFATPWLETNCKKDAPVAGMRGDHPQPDTWLTEKADGLATLQLRLTHRVKVLDPSIEPLLDLPALLSRVWIRVDVAVVTRGQNSTVRGLRRAASKASPRFYSCQAHHLQHQAGQR